MRRILPFLVVAVAASAVTAAAIVIPARAGDGERPFADRIQRFEECMRAHGFDLAGDTEIRVRPGEATINGKRVDPEKFLAAERECGPPFGPGLGLELAFPRSLGDLPDEMREHVQRLQRCLEQESGAGERDGS